MEEAESKMKQQPNLIPDYHPSYIPYYHHLDEMEVECQNRQKHDTSSWMECHSDKSQWHFGIPRQNVAISDTELGLSQSRRPKMRVIQPQENFTFQIEVNMNDIDTSLDEYPEETSEEELEKESEEESKGILLDPSVNI